MQKKIELVVANIDEAPSCFYIVNASGECVFAKTKSRAAAQLRFDEEFGKSFYSVRSTDLAAKAGKRVTAR